MYVVEKDDICSVQPCSELSHVRYCEEKILVTGRATGAELMNSFINKLDAPATEIQGDSWQASRVFTRLWQMFEMGPPFC